MLSMPDVALTTWLTCVSFRVMAIGDSDVFAPVLAVCVGGLGVLVSVRRGLLRLADVMCGKGVAALCAWWCCRSGLRCIDGGSRGCVRGSGG